MMNFILLYFALIASEEDAKNLVDINKDFSELKINTLKINKLKKGTPLYLDDLIPLLNGLKSKNLDACSKVFNTIHQLPHQNYTLENMQYFCLFNYLQSMPNKTLTETSYQFFELAIDTIIYNHTEWIYDLLDKTKDRPLLFDDLTKLTEDITSKYNIILELPSEKSKTIPSGDLQLIIKDPLKHKNLLKTGQFSPSELLTIASIYLTKDPYITLKILKKLPTDEDTIFLSILGHYLTKNFRRIKKTYKQVDDLSIKNRFWISYTLQSKNKELATTNYKKIIKDHPLNYYAILSMIELSALNESFNYDFSTTNQEFEEPELTPEIEESLTRLSYWGKLNELNLLSKELSFLKLLSQDPNIFYQAIQVLEKDKEHLAVFQLIYDLLESKIFMLNKTILTKLFPIEYTKEISKNNFNLPLVLSIIRQESAFNPKAKSKANAYGAMQILPGTARMVSKLKQPHKLFDPEININIGTTYLDKLINSTNQNIIKALMAYNAGPRNVKKWENRDIFNINDLIGLELTPFYETRNYVKLIIRNFFFYVLINNDYNLDTAITEVTNIFFSV